MRAVDDLKERVEGGVRSRLSMNSDGSRGIAQLVQSRANGQGHSVECCGIGRFAKTWGELVFFEQFFDLLLRAHPRAGIFDTREKGLLLEVKKKSHEFLGRRGLTIGRDSPQFLHAKRAKPGS